MTSDTLAIGMRCNVLLKPKAQRLHPALARPAKPQNSYFYIAPSSANPDPVDTHMRDCQSDSQSSAYLIPNCQRIKPCPASPLDSHASTGLPPRFCIESPPCSVASTAAVSREWLPDVGENSIASLSTGSALTKKSSSSSSLTGALPFPL